MKKIIPSKKSYLPKIPNISHRHIEAECLEDIYKFDDLDIAEYKNIGSSKDIKNIFYRKNGGKGLINEIEKYSKNRFKGNEHLIEEKIIEFIIDESKDKKEYIEFKKKLKRFFDIK